MYLYHLHIVCLFLPDSETKIISTTFPKSTSPQKLQAMTYGQILNRWTRERLMESFPIPTDKLWYGQTSNYELDFRILI